MNGAELRRYRLAAKMRQAELGELMGVSQPTVSELERQEGEEIPAELAARLPPLAGGIPPPQDPPAGDTEPPPPPDGGDVAPKRTRRRAPKQDGAGSLVLVPPDDRRLNELEVRLLKLIQGEEMVIMVADPGSTELRPVTQHLPGVADLVGVVDEFDGHVIRAHAVTMAKAWVKLAREKPRVLAVLEGLTAGGAWRDVVAATAPVILAILLHHGLLPTGIPGLTVTPPAGYDEAANGNAGGAHTGSFEYHPPA